MIMLTIYYRVYSNQKNRRQFCKVNSIAPDVQEKNIWVPQGPCLDLLLFHACTYDLQFSLRKTKVTTYADDTTVSYSSENAHESKEIANAELTSLEKWLQGHKFPLNVFNIQAMIIGLSKKLKNINICATKPKVLKSMGE